MNNYVNRKKGEIFDNISAKVDQKREIFGKIAAKVDQKREIFGKIAALRVSCEGFPQFNITNSFGSICNGTNSLDFLLDLLKATIGFEALTNITSDILTYQIPDIEDEIKKVLKVELKKLVSCGVNPSIPNYILHQNINPTSTGIDMEMKNIDYLDSMYVEPTSQSGEMVYEDNNSGLNSTDFNVFLHETLQQSGVQNSWGSQTIGEDVLSLQFDQFGTPNNNLNVKVSEYYSNPVNGKKLVDVNNDYIDSISLFGTSNLLANIVDSLFGSISFNVNKTSEQIKKEVELEDTIQCILNADCDIIIDDTYFEFDNEALRRQDEDIESRKRGFRILKTCNDVVSNIDFPTLLDTTNDIKSATTAGDVSTATISALNTLSGQASKDVSNQNRITVQLDFINSVIKKLMVKLGTILMSPKIMIIFALNYSVIHGTTIDNPLDFIKNNKNLMQSILNSIRDAIIAKLLDVALKEIIELVKCQAINIATESAKNQAAQLASLVGIPQDVLRVILGIGSQILDNPPIEQQSGQRITGFGCRNGDCNG